MDLMEEFEFKPLTDGLGFHKKKLEDDKSNELPSFLEETSLPIIPEKIEAKKKILEEKVSGLPFDFSQTTQASQGLQSTKSSPMPSLFSPTLPRESLAPTQASIAPAPVTVPKLHAPKFKSIDKNATIQTEVSKTQAVQEVAVSNKIEITKEAPIFKPSYNFVTSILLDTFVVIGLAVLFTLGLVLATGLDIVSIVSQSIYDLGTQVGVALLLYSVTQLYLIISRSFFGQTLGEWSIEQQLGTAEEQIKVSYVFKLLARTLIITFTGFVLLPIVSLVARKDITGKLCGVSLYKRE